MKQQQTLFNAMNLMVPVLEGAQNILSNSLKGLTSATGIGI